MRAHILGSAAGGGFPQWNCGCALCRGVRAGTRGLSARTQTSVAVSSDGARWFLLCASPDVRAQLEAARPLRPRGTRGSPIEGVLLPSADIDATAGLLSMREGEPLQLIGTKRVLAAFLEQNVLAATLRRTPSQLSVGALPLSSEVALRGRDGAATGLVVSAFPARGKSPPHLAARRYEREDNVGFTIRDEATGESLAFAPCVGEVDDAIVAAVDGASALLFDGTFWSDDELASVAPGAPSARAMGHVPVGGRDGTLALLARARARRRLFVHVNNTNPMLNDDGRERAEVRAAGWDVAHDGMEVLP